MKWHIGAGDLSSPVGEEPFPNGGRVNMGAYGGTGEASSPGLQTLFLGRLSQVARTEIASLIAAISVAGGP